MADRLEEKMVARFWSKVDRTGSCWTWTAAKHRNGYGSFSIHLRNSLAHRVAYLIANGSILDGALVLHRCDNRACVNPKHLYAGTYSDNQRDTFARNPLARLAIRRTRQLQIGERHHQSKLTEDQVRQIRATKGIATNRAVAAQYGISQSTVGAIRSGRTWRHVV